MATLARRIVAPEPPADRARIRLPHASAAISWFRLAPKGRMSPLHWNRDGRFRFDSPAARWGVCYAAESPLAALQEVWGDEIRRAGHLDWTELERTVAWRIDVAPNLRAVELAGETLAAIKGTLQSFTGGYSLSQRWGRALMVHPADLDGLQYSGRRCGRPCLALFGDGKNPKAHQAALRVERLGSMARWRGLWAFLDRAQIRVANLPASAPPADWQ